MVYIDDVLVMNQTFDEHIALLEKVLTTLEMHGVKVKPGKCMWFQSEVDYLGHIIGADGIKKSRVFVQRIE